MKHKLPRVFTEVPLKLEPTWSVLITRADNGYILERIEHLNDGGYRKEFDLVQANREEDDVDEGFLLLHAVRDFFDLSQELEIIRKPSEILLPPRRRLGKKAKASLKARRAIEALVVESERMGEYADKRRKRK